MNMPVKTSIAVVLMTLAFASSSAQAEETFKLNPNNNIRKLLVYHLDKVVTLQTISGKELTGTVTTIGEHLVQLSNLSGREFYDAMVDYDHIEAVVVKVRTK